MCVTDLGGDLGNFHLDGRKDRVHAVCAQCLMVFLYFGALVKLSGWSLSWVQGGIGSHTRLLPA